MSSSANTKPTTKTVGFLVNESNQLGPKQTTTMLIREAVRTAEVLVFDIHSLSRSSAGKMTCLARRLPLTETPEKLPQFTDWVNSRPLERAEISDLFWLAIRTNPGRDPQNQSAHLEALRYCQQMQRKGVTVFNDPAGLFAAASKSYLCQLPESVVPKSLVTNNADEVLAFASAHERAVVKPVMGSRGGGVFVLDQRHTANHREIVKTVLDQGTAIVQEYVPGADQGDSRVLLYNGQLLRVGDDVAGIRRVPAKGDFRSNLHAGGSAEQLKFEERYQVIADAIAPMLQRDGLVLVGADIIGDKLIELNVFSTGGLFGAEEMTGHNFSRMIIDFWNGQNQA